MDWYDRKARKNILRLILLTVLLAGTYFLYAYYRTENMSDYQMQNSYTGLKHIDTVRRSETRTFVSLPVDTAKMLSSADSQVFSDIHAASLPVQKDSLASKPAALHPYNPVTGDIKEEGDAGAIQGSAGVFTHTYTIAIGKTVPVNILWQDADAKAVSYKLVTIKADDIADEKVTFTIEDPYNVLLFSQTEYGVNDNITIADDRHNLNIRVLQVHTNSVVVNVVSHVDENIVSKLQRIR